MALTFGSSSSYSCSYARYPIRVSVPTVVAVKKRVTFTAVAEVLPPPTVAATVQFHIPYTTIDLFFRPEMMMPLAHHDTPPIYLVIDDVPAVALPAIRLYIEKINEHAKIDHSPTTKRLIVSCASREHNYMANIGPEILQLITSDDSSFTGNDPVFEIIENTDSEIPLGDEKRGRQPDGGLRLLNSDSRPPFLVWEVLDSQPLAQMIEKISHYFTQSHGRIHIVVVIQLIRQRASKRKRRPSSIGDRLNTEGPSRVAEDTDDGEPVLPQPPPPGRLVQGFYWVYRHARNTAGKRVIQCPMERQEFYPARPTGVLTLAWTDIMHQVPPQLASKSVTIPFTILHERFRKMVDTASVPPPIDDPEPQDLGDWDLTDFPGIGAAADRSDPASTSEVSDDGADPSFEGVAATVPDEAAGPRRSARLLRG